MKKADGGLRKTIHTGLPGPEWDWLTIETGSTTAGVPDSAGLHRPSGTSLWIESKKTDHWAIKFEPHQIKWWRIWGPHVRGFIAVKALGAAATGGKGEALFLYRGIEIDALDRVGLRNPPGLMMAGPSRSWDWRAVSDYLLGS